VKLTDPSNTKLYNKTEAYNWKIVPNENKDRFHIQLDYKDYEKKPRLVSSHLPNQINIFTDCRVSTQDSRGYGK
jgi:hypothetical protein